ncbi:MAG: DUF3999 domain-containing protein [Betaproteobacteria bacterium]
MKRLIRQAIPWMAIALMVPLGHAADTPADYAGAVTLTTTSREAMHRLELPMTVYAGIQHPDLRDLRVFNAAGEPVPFALAADLPPAAVPAPAVFIPPIFPIWGEGSRKGSDQLDVRIDQRPDGSVIAIRSKAGAMAPAPGRQAVAFLVDAAKIESSLARLRPQWRETPVNYIGSVRVEASDDLKVWRTVVNGAPLVYLAQGEARLVQDAIEFAATRARYYRIALSPVGPELVELAAEAPVAHPERQRLTLRVAGKLGAKPGEIEYDVGVRAPVDRVRMIVAESNALAPVKIETRTDAGSEWRQVAATVAYRMTREGQDLTSPAVSVAPNSGSYWRAVIDQAGGGLGAALPELELSWPVRHLVFVARGQGPFTLAFGKRDAIPATLPLATLIPGYQTGSEAAFPVAGVSEIKLRATPAPSVIAQVIGDTEPRKLGLWAALLVGVLVLALMAWRLSRQMRRGEGAAQAMEKTTET